MRKTKIVATLGPACNDYKTLKNLILAGANVIRVNFSHGTIPEYENIFNLIKQIRTELNVPVAIMADTRGPEVRVKTFASGCTLLKKGKTFTFYGYDKEGSDVVSKSLFAVLMRYSSKYSRGVRPQTSEKSV